jgi:hypothetical protein
VQISAHTQHCVWADICTCTHIQIILYVGVGRYQVSKET